MASVLLVASVGVIFILCSTFGHEGEHNEEMAKKLQSLKSRWEVDEVIRDPSHIKEDLKDLLDLSRNQTITPDDTYFYFIRMHDWDQNDGLDGIEIFHAMEHVYEHYNMDGNVTVEQISEHVDMMLKDDANADGFLTYTEYKRAADINAAKARETQNQ